MPCQHLMGLQQVALGYEETCKNEDKILPLPYLTCMQVHGTSV